MAVLVPAGRDVFSALILEPNYILGTVIKLINM